MNKKIFNVFIGSETGLLKGVDIERKAWDNLNVLQGIRREQEITSICWGNNDKSQVCYGLRNQSVYIYDTNKQEFSESHHLLGGEGGFCGLGRVDDSFVTCSRSGLLRLWTDSPTEIQVGDNLNCMKQNPEQPHLVSTGGKENDLKLWDLQRPDKPIFKAKNVRDDWLCLRVPVWVMDTNFLQDSQKLVTCTGYHQVRVYDPSSSQRRPVIDISFDEYPLKSMGIVHGQPQVIVGNTHGKMALMDLRKGGKMVHVYKGFAGSIRCVECHPTLPLVVTCGLDRFLRVHHIETKELLHKIYLKSRLNCLLLTDAWAENKAEDGDSAKRSESIHQSEDSGRGSDPEDELWKNMDVIESSSAKRNSKHIVTNRKKMKTFHKDHESATEKMSGKVGKQKEKSKKSLDEEIEEHKPKQKEKSKKTIDEECEEESKPKQKERSKKSMNETLESNKIRQKIKRETPNWNKKLDAFRHARLLEIKK